MYSVMSVEVQTEQKNWDESLATARSSRHRKWTTWTCYAQLSKETAAATIVISRKPVSNNSIHHLNMILMLQLYFQFTVGHVHTAQHDQERRRKERKLSHQSVKSRTVFVSILRYNVAAVKAPGAWLRHENNVERRKKQASGWKHAKKHLTNC